MKARTARAMVSPIASWKPTRNKSFALNNIHCALVTFIVYLGLRSLYRYSSGFCIPWSKRYGPFHDELLSSLSEWWWCTFWSYRDNEMDIHNFCSTLYFYRFLWNWQILPCYKPDDKQSYVFREINSLSSSQFGNYGNLLSHFFENISWKQHFY